MFLLCQVLMGCALWAIAAGFIDELSPIWPGGDYGDASHIKAFGSNATLPVLQRLFPFEIIDGRGPVVFGRDGVLMPDLCGDTVSVKALTSVIPGPVSPQISHSDQRQPSKPLAGATTSAIQDKSDPDGRLDPSKTWTVDQQ